MPPVTLEREGRVAVIVIDNPPVNAISPAVGEGVIDIFHDLERDPGIDAIVMVGAGRNFIAGADIRNFGKDMVRPGVGHRVVDLIDQGSKPVVAAIHGHALGGGLEYAMTCHYRIAHRNARLGLPEVLIGVLPGGGGTQRLPRLIGPAAALDIILSGRHVPATEACTLGLVDALIDPQEDLRAAAIAFALSVVATRPLPRVRDRQIEPAERAGVARLFSDARKALAQRAPNQKVPYQCLLAVEAGCTLPFEEGLKEERRLFDEIEPSAEGKALRHAFFAEREAARLPDIADAADPPGQAGPAGAHEGGSLAVIGAGTMGSGIAMSAADAGLQVRLYDARPEALARGMEGIQRHYRIDVERGRLTQAQSLECMARIQPVASLASVGDCDAVVEAVAEDLQIKQQIFARLDAIMKPQALLLTHTSALDIDLIAAATARPHSVAGAHFFRPVQLMKLLEVVRCDKTSDAALKATMRLGRRLGKTCVVTRNGEGCVTRRSRLPLTTEAMILREEGVRPEQIDRVMTDFGYPAGPFAAGDLAGPGHSTTRLRQQAAGLGTGGKAFTDTEILHRLLFGAVNECCRILQEGRVYRASDIDVAWVNGLGFPRFRGGLMFWADQLGAAVIAEQVSAWHAALGSRWAPAPLLLHAALTGQNLREIKPMLTPIALEAATASGLAETPA